MINLINTDCTPHMEQCKDNEYDLAIVDPPYGIGESGKKNKSRSKLAIAKDYKPFAGGDLKPPGKDYFKELKRVSKNQIIWGANHFASGFKSSSPAWIVWDKENGNSSFADVELAYTSFNTAARVFRYMWNGMHQGGFGGDKSKNEKRIHPTQKPVKLYEWLLKNYASEGDKILDTHGGSMSSAIACHNMGFDMTLCELDKSYFDSGKERFNNHIKQMRMF